MEGWRAFAAGYRAGLAARDGDKPCGEDDAWQEYGQYLATRLDEQRSERMEEPVSPGFEVEAASFIRPERTIWQRQPNGLWLCKCCEKTTEPWSNLLDPVPA